MGYASWSVVFGEQPSAAKWNTLGTNDSSFNDGTGIANLEIGSGHTSLKNDYKFGVYLSANQTITNSTDTVVAFDTKIFDTSTNIDVATNKGRFTAPVAGFYLFNTILNTSTGTGNITSYRKNGSATGGYRMAQLNASGYSGGTELISLATSDYIEVYYFQNSGSSQTVNGGTNPYLSHFSGFLVSQQ